MNIIFMRHGEATDNVAGIISDKEIYNSTLTKKGREYVLNTCKLLPPNILKIYTSPFPRTLETANIVLKKYPGVPVIVDNRLREIYYGKYSGAKNNKELDEIRLRQINGDYFVRFGEYGKNKFAIETRLCSFLKDIWLEDLDSTVLIVSHGAIISYMKRILNLKTKHINMGEWEIFKHVDFAYLSDHISMLKVKGLRNNEKI